MIAVLRFLFVIPIGFVAGCFAASFALLWPFLELPSHWWTDTILSIDLFLGFMAQAAQIGAAALVPWAVFMVVSELARLSSLLVHIGVGALAGLALSRSWYGDAASPSIQTAMIAGGLAFFMVYWIVAGRRAGHWRRPNPSTATSLDKVFR